MNRCIRSAGSERKRAGAPSLEGSRRRGALAALPLIGVALLASCGALTDDEFAVGGETHFLVTCQDECGPGLSCIAGVCTRGCEPGYSSCSELSAGAACVSAPDGTDRAGFAGTCDVLCSDDADCSSFPAGYTCRAGACRADATLALGSTGSPQRRLVHAVDFDTCQSGLRWMGADRASPEMHPGSDCVGCHREKGARPLAVGGTVYGGHDPGVPDPLDDCFGLEGVEMKITDAAGREFSTITNRAGNFYIEGDESDFAMPYTATLSYTRDGELLNAAMFTVPSYGGCASCHGLDAGEAGASDEFDAYPAADGVIPAHVIFAPGLGR
jgi:hypothetical protein